jgi:hypothetical protein
VVHVESPVCSRGGAPMLGFVGGGDGAMG